jgi:microsomal dipeptidase-like Zn-dependent dipeptidase
MIDSRLYYDLKEILQGILNFYYYTAEMDGNAVDLKSFTKTINQQEVLTTIDNIGIKSLLFNINEAEFVRFLKEIKEYKNYVEELSQTDLSAANIAFAKLWGPNELQRKFAEWFTKNGYAIPKNNNS